MPEPASGLIHIEYHVDALGSVEFMKVWASTVRGHWDLVCEHWMHARASYGSGLRFANKSEGLENARVDYATPGDISGGHARWLRPHDPGLPAD